MEKDNNFNTEEYSGKLRKKFHESYRDPIKRIR